MSKNNNCNFIGNLTRDVEIRNTKTGYKIAALGLAVNDSYKAKDSDDWIEKPVAYLDLEAWGDIASNLEKLRKGSRVSVECEAKVDSWDDKTTGTKRNKVIFKVLRFEEIQRTQKENVAPKEEKPVKRAYTRTAKVDMPQTQEKVVDDVPF